MDNEIQIWFEEAEKREKVFSNLHDEFVIYKGFKITKNRFGTYMLQDVRFSNMYAPSNEKCYKIFKDLGFIKGADSISFERDVKRVAFYKRKTEQLYDKRRRCKKEMPKDKRLNEKRIRNINKKIKEYVDLIFFYETRIKQFNSKYNAKD